MASYWFLNFYLRYKVGFYGHMYNHITHLKTVPKKNKFYISYINCKILLDTIYLSFCDIITGYKVLQ